MDPFFQAFRTVFDPLQESMRKTIESLPQAALDWSPGPEENSLAVLTAHVSGSNRFLLLDVILGEDTNRDRSAEFRTSGVDLAALLALLDKQEQALQDTLARLRAADLQSERVHPRTGKPVTVAWALLHMLEHTAQHVGHMEMTRKAWEQQSG